MNDIWQGLVQALSLLVHGDPELYDEVLDVFRNDERKRVMERRGRTALTWTRDQYVARLLVEVKDRIGRDRITDFSDPRDNDKDFDVQPDLPVNDRDAEDINTNRWGRVTERMPQITAETIWLRMWNLPLYYHTDLNLFNNLDKGINTVDREDDAWVQGGDWYHALLWRWKISPRYTALTQVGGGAGAAVRDQQDFDFDYVDDYFDDGYYPPLDLPDVEGGLDFTDRDTFLIGEEPFNPDQIKDGFGYGDFKERLHARFTDALIGDLIYRYRATTDDFLGDWYAEMGDKWVRSDLYNFRLRENNIEAILRYVLAHPRLTVFLRAYQNLVGEDDLFPQELVSSYGTGAYWSNDSGTFQIGPSVGFSERQIRHPSDPDSYIDSYLHYGLSAGYRPLSDLWWTKLALSYRQGLSRSNGDNHDYDKNRNVNYF
jgi:hypothetical protein